MQNSRLYYGFLIIAALAIICQGCAGVQVSGGVSWEPRPGARVEAWVSR